MVSFDLMRSYDNVNLFH